MKHKLHGSEAGPLGRVRNYLRLARSHSGPGWRDFIVSNYDNAFDVLKDLPSSPEVEALRVEVKLGIEKLS
ncbi:hypothetical protein CMI37_16200 [Candidatus Pacearchaeota archaeon]|nr:hypothetical protein [Candidatus Pacearchaeota archaeon]|tara:strand:+ start:2886 stop:3098 length:213 start_codon:yes stop_codon:yes gene_type:complete